MDRRKKDNNPKPVSRPVGRPTKYRPEYAEQAKHLCRLGATDYELATAFEVDLSTINLWKIRHAAFSEAIKEYKVSADDRVEQSLYKRAMGYSLEETDIKVIDGEIVETTIVKHYPPDSTALIFWLKNRQPDKWRQAPDPDQGVDVKKLDEDGLKRLADGKR